MATAELTPRQAEYVEAIRRIAARTGRPPSIAELAREVGVASTNAVYGVLEALRRKGAVAPPAPGGLVALAAPPPSVPDPPAGLLDALTDAQAEVLAFVVGHLRRHGIGPTYREIGSAFAWSPNGVRSHVRPLVRKGALHPPRRGLSRDLVPSWIPRDVGG